MILRRRGSTMVEYATLVIATMSAILLMVTYIRRAVAGKLRDAADGIGPQYTPGDVTGTSRTTTSGATLSSTRLVPEVIDGNRVMVQEITTGMTPDTTRTVSSEDIGPLGTDLWN